MQPRWIRPLIRTSIVCTLLLAVWGTVLAQGPGPVITVDHGPNAPAQRSKHYVVLVSLDGFRYDYARRYGARHLQALAARGATALQGMIPSYPSLTFPNHYTIVTGLYPEHHGIVANSFYDPQRKREYSFRDEATVTDGLWYGGTPLWVLAEQQGMRAACFFWPGSEAAIQGTRPSYYLKYDIAVPNPRRVAQVLEWLRLPPERRPHFITLYFSDTDAAGHKYGPDSAQEAQAVQEVDKEIGTLVSGLESTRLPVDLIVLSDHGMAKVEGGWVHLDQYLDPALLDKTVGLAVYPKSDAAAQKLYDALRGEQGMTGEYAVYRRAGMPKYLHYDSNPRAGDPIVVATGPYALAIAASATVHSAGEVSPPDPGIHGFDPKRLPDMKASFFAAGPDIRPGVAVPPFENVNVYPLVARILGLDITRLKTGPIDGSLTTLQDILRKGE